VLDTERDGNYLVFYTDHIADFAILGDPVMNLTPFIIALGLILACQLIAIILMLARRVKNARRTYHASVALPVVALTVRFLPANGLTLALILGVCVVILQIILMYLLLSTEMVHQHKPRESKPHREPEARPAMAEAEPEMNDEAEEDVEPEDEDAEYLPFMLNEDTEESDPFDDFEEDGDTPEEAVAEENALDDSVYVDLRTGEVFGDTDSYEDFIEPAANPRYSLPEEDAPVYGEPEDAYTADSVSEDAVTEELSGADVYGDEPSADAAEWQYDDSDDQPEELEQPIEDGEGFVFEPTYDDGEDDYYDDSVRGEPAEDLPQEEPVTGEPADDLIEDEPVRGELPEYEQPAEDEETKKYDGYEE
jgi:hypothetical protein